MSYVESSRDEDCERPVVVITNERSIYNYKYLCVDKVVYKIYAVLSA